MAKMETCVVRRRLVAALRLANVTHDHAPRLGRPGKRGDNQIICYRLLAAATARRTVNNPRDKRGVEQISFVILSLANANDVALIGSEMSQDSNHFVEMCPVW